jgi:RNA recognition motif-containing protein
MSESTRLKSTVYVGSLDQAVTAQTLTEAFLPFGEVVDISLPKPDLPSSTDNHRGFGYVEFEVPQDAKEAIDNMDQSELYGRIIKVAAAKPQRDANEGLGSKTAIWEQVSLDFFITAKILQFTPSTNLTMILAGGLLGETCRERGRQKWNRRGQFSGQRST